MEDITKKISYKPDIKYTDEYESDIKFNSNSNDNLQGDDFNDNNGNTEIDDLLDQGDGLQNMIDNLSDDLSDIIKDHVDPIIDFVKNELKDKELHKVPVEIQWEYEEYEPPDFIDDDKNSIDNPDYDNIWEPDDPITIKKTIHKQDEVIEKEYVKNLYDLFYDYYSNLHNITSRFWVTTLCSILNKETSEIELIMNNILLNSSQIKDNNKHLLDLAVKSEITADMKFKYFSNNFNAEQSMKHLKQFKAVYELRLRYAKIEKNATPKTKADQMSNNMLKSMDLSYSLKYDKAYENLYRYLKSSNVILEDSLNSMAQSIKAKQALVETKGVK